ncbi:hypothetical protein [Micromonospora sp. SH-82]|uniref:hypothetical protein n=1 Tax=Micromonospora sp. SH-82 TaxID=3132938 RepID=UPI003EC0D216
MIFRGRRPARFGAAVLLAAGIVAGLGAPAYAASTETDLSLDVVGTRLADEAPLKLAFAKITNRGKNTPTALSVSIDVSKVDIRYVLAAPAGTDCEIEGSEERMARWTCAVPADELPGPGETLDLPIVVFKFGERKGAYSAPVTVTISSPDDTDTSNNRRTAKLELTKKSGPDLFVLADDVKQSVEVKGGELRVLGDLHAGETGVLTYFGLNQGDEAAAGLRVRVTLPKGVTFTETDENCEYDADRTSAVCTHRNLPLAPFHSDDEGDAEGYGFLHLLTVAKGVKAGSLSGGEVTVEPLAGELRTATAKPKSLPKNVTVLTDVEDIDASDNTDSYAVIVAARGGDGGGGEEPPGLPVTGPQAGLIGGIGVAVLLAGGAMFLVSRRRRVVLVAPADEKSDN